MADLPEMKTLTINGNTFEVVDEAARKALSKTDNIYIADDLTVTYAKVKAAYDAGRKCFLLFRMNYWGTLLSITDTAAIFAVILHSGNYTIVKLFSDGTSDIENHYLNAVQYSEQSLTDDQKAQARANIDAEKTIAVQSPDPDNPMDLGDLEIGYHFLSGYFVPYKGAESARQFGKHLVFTMKYSDGSHRHTIFAGPENMIELYTVDKIGEDYITESQYVGFESVWAVLQSSARTAVSYEEQTLTEAQKAQARTNIGALKYAKGTSSQVLSFNEQGEPEAKYMDWSFVGTRRDRLICNIRQEDLTEEDIPYEFPATASNGTPTTLYRVSDVCPSETELQNAGKVYQKIALTIQDDPTGLFFGMFSGVILNLFGSVAFVYSEDNELGYPVGTYVVVNTLEISVPGFTGYPESYNVLDNGYLPTLGVGDITAGTFSGRVVANSGGQPASTSCVRNSKLVSTDTNPTVEGEICWTYK